MGAWLEALVAVLFFVLLLVIALVLGQRLSVGRGKSDIRLGGWEASRVFTRPLGSAESGRPSVIFISGLGNDNTWWNWDEAPDEIVNAQHWARNTGIQKPIAALTRTLSFDMPGVGESPVSDPDEVPVSFRDAARLVLELGEKAGLPTPWVLVGHSLGGAIALVFQDLYPLLTRGVVVIDSPSPATLVEIGAPSFYTKTGALKYQVSRRYLDNYSRAREEVPFTKVGTRSVIAHVNETELAPGVISERDRAHVKFAVDTYPTTVVHRNASHWIHVTHPSAILESIETFLAPA